MYKMTPCERVEGALSLDGLLVSHEAATYFVNVSGDSMVGEGIRDGDLLVVDRSIEPRSGDVVIASVNGEFLVRRYVKGEGGVRLESGNPGFPVVRLRDGQELDCFGKVTACIHRFK